MKSYFRFLSLVLLLAMASGSTITINAQTTVTGSVADGQTGEPLIGVNIVVKDQVIGTITNTDGNFNLSIQQPPPFTLRISMIGFITQEMDITQNETTGIQLSRWRSGQPSRTGDLCLPARTPAHSPHLRT